MPNSFEWKADERGTIKREQLRQRASAGDVALEGVFGLDNLRHVFILQQALILQRAVCRLSRGPATGFLIATDLLVTNHHILPDIASARDCTARFNFQLAIGYVSEPAEELKLVPDDFFYTNAQHDFAISKVEGAPGTRWGYIALRRANPQVGNAAFLIQHPGGAHKKISIGDNEIKAIVEGGTRLQYLTDTAPGSSGSPIFDESMALVGVHHATKLLPDLSGYFRNEGIHINTVIESLPAGVPVET